VVDFKSVFERLNGAGFYGPFTFELEGIQGEELDESATRERVAKSLRYLKELGVIER
jgi:sugar phosphate isomerase/epimerase